MIEKIGLFDLSFGLFYLLTLFILLHFYTRFQPQGSLSRQFLIPAVIIKVLGAIFFVLIHSYYYQWGDTFGYFYGGKGISQLVWESPEEVFRFFTSSAGNYQPPSFDFYFFDGKDTYETIRITSIISFFSFNSYLITNINASLLSLIGIWLGFKVFSDLYPKMRKSFFFAFFLIPSYTFWGSGVIKETYVIGAMGIVIWAFYQLYKGKFHFTYLIAILISSYIITTLKPYVFYTFFPFLLFWIFLKMKNLIRNQYLQIISFPIFLSLFGVFGYLVIDLASANAGKYALNNLESVAVGFHSWHTHLAETRGQSGYSLGDVDFTPLGMLSKFPAAINATLFRPYLWEVKNLTTGLASLEGIAMLFLLVRALIKTNIIKLFKSIASNPETLFSLLFTLTFGFAVGFTSYNFGALSRYKIPMMPFFMVFLILTNFQPKETKLLEK